jgi:hypothetical protein
MKWMEYVAKMGEITNGHMTRKPERKTPHKRLRRRWVDNIKIDLRKNMV